MDGIEEQKELEKLLSDLPDDDEDEEDDNTGDGSSNSEKPDENNSEDGTEEGNSEDDSNIDDNKKAESNNDDDPWKGKSREEVIAAHKALEEKIKTLESKPDDKGKKNESEENKPEKNKEKDTLPSPEELQKMSPSDFAKWVLARIDEGVKKTIETQDKIKGAVQKEISDAKKEHPLDQPEYRKMVLAIIEAGSAKGTIVALKDACQQVDAFLGKNKGDQDNNELSDNEKSRLKKAKAQIESGAGAPIQTDSSDAETKRIQKALGGSESKSPLGGLGI